MNLLETLAGEVLSGIANTGLRLDPEIQGRLKDLDGTALRLELIAPSQSIVLRVTAGELRVQPGSEYPVQTIVRGTMTDLLALLRGAAPSPGLEISGDPALLTRFAALLHAYRPKLDEFLPAGFAPGTATANSGAEQLLGLIEEGIDSARRALVGVARQGRSTIDNLAKNELMTRTDQLRLEREIDELRLGIDRLTARLAVTSATAPQASEEP